jgi:hypothetical protein
MFRSDLAIVTPSYRPDLERCKALCTSVRKFVDPEIEHVLIVPRRDRAAFAPLANERTRIVTVESILPIKAWQIPFQRKWWLTACSLPVRGWILQQLTKLSAVNAVKTDAIMFADSDLVFVRPFSSDHVWHDGRLRLHRVPGPAPKPTHERWHRDTGRLMALEPSDWYGADYIGQLITWRCDTVRDMLEHITKTTGRHWAKHMANMLQLSEYILYGIYVEHVIDAKGHEFVERDLCHCSWHYGNLHTGGTLDVEAFLKEIQPHHIAVLLQSNLGLPESWHTRLAEGGVI